MMEEEEEEEEEDCGEGGDWVGGGRVRGITITHQEVKEHAVAAVDDSSCPIGPLHNNLVDLVSQSVIISEVKEHL